MVLNVDIGFSLLQLAVDWGLLNRVWMDILFTPCLTGDQFDDWRKHFVYEYHWEWNFRHSPLLLRFVPIAGNIFSTTVSGTAMACMIYRRTLTSASQSITVPAFRDRAVALREKLFDELESSGPLTLPVRRPKNDQYYDRKIPPR